MNIILLNIAFLKKIKKDSQNHDSKSIDCKDLCLAPFEKLSSFLAANMKNVSSPIRNGLTFSRA